MLFSRFTVMASLALSLSLSTAIQATDGTPYVGIATGGTHSNLGYGVTNKDSSSIGTKLKAGYQIDRNIAVEMSYANLGKVTGSVPGIFNRFTIKTNKVVEVSGIASIPVTDELDITLRTGWYKAHSHAKDINAGAIKSNTTGLVTGIGLKYAINNDINLNGEFARYNHVGTGVQNFEHDIDFTSVGVDYTF